MGLLNTYGCLEVRQYLVPKRRKKDINVVTSKKTITSSDYCINASSKGILSTIIIHSLPTSQKHNIPTMKYFSSRIAGHSYFVALLCCAFVVIDAAISSTYTVRCLERAPQICVGETTVQTPNMYAYSNGTTVSSGKRSWEYEFVEGLVEGESYYYDRDILNKAKTGHYVYVEMENDQTVCGIFVDGELCQSCSTCGFDSFEVRYNCTNLENGGDSGENCVSVQSPFLYPLDLTGVTINPEETEVPISITQDGVAAGVIVLPWKASFWSAAVLGGAVKWLL